MSYGVSIRTVAGELLLDERFTVPAMIGKPTLSYWGTHVMSGNDTQRADEYRWLIPSTTNGELLYFWTMPTFAADCRLIPVISNLLSDGDPRSGRGFGYDSMLVIRPTAMSAAAALPNGLPELYAFGASNLAPTGLAYGLRVFKADGSIAFDIGYKHLQLVGEMRISSTATSQPTNIVTNPIGAEPAKAAFFFAPHGSAVWVTIGAAQSSNAVFWERGIWRDGNALKTALVKTGVAFEDLPNIPSSHAGQTFAFCPFINAALYD